MLIFYLIFVNYYLLTSINAKLGREQNESRNTAIFYIIHIFFTGFITGRPKTTGHSHNASATTCRSANRSGSSATSSGQRLLTDLFVRRNDNTALSSVEAERMQTVGETRDSAMEDTQSNVGDSSDDSINKHSEVETNQNELDGRSYLLIHQSWEKWENAYPFLFFSKAKNGWLCSLCIEYGKGDKFWRTKGEHPKRIFERHQKSPKHEEALMRQAEIKAMLRKGSVYKQSLMDVKGQGQKHKKRNSSD